MTTRRAVLAGGAAVAALPRIAVAAPDPAEAIARRVVRARIPRRDIVVRGDGDDSIARALAACAAAGGGRVVVPAGAWRSGPLRLDSRTELHLAAGARVTFVTDPERYLPPVESRWEGVELMGYHPLIYAVDATDVAVTGAGTLDGGADDAHWWPWKGPWANRYASTPPAERQAADRARLFEQAERGVPVRERVYGRGSRLRPPFLLTLRCDRVTLEGVTVTNSPFWVIHPVLCRSVLVRGVTVSSHGPNNDGIDPESCTDVLIEDCTFDTGDDCVAIKSGRNADGRRVGRACENVVVRRCRMKDGHGGIAIGSELSGGIRNVHVEDCRFESPNLLWALTIKTNGYRGGVVEDIHLRRLTIGGVRHAAFQLWMFYEEGAGGGFVPVVRRVSIRDMTVGQVGRALVVRGRDDSPVRDLTLANVRIAGEAKPSVIAATQGLQLDGVTIGGRRFGLAEAARLPGLDSISCDKWAQCR